MPASGAEVFTASDSENNCTGDWVVTATLQIKNAQGDWVQMDNINGGTTSITITYVADSAGGGDGSGDVPF
jgi:hypothetical protein